ncbi:MAG TPA: hypothetical protein DDY98_00900 [Ruminococcaceae bacterium]|nr:hypothetical protein [Oscillospiraceae bacterium]
MKKIIAFLLTLCLAFTAIAVPGFAEQAEDLQLAVASDLHYNIPNAKLEKLIDDPIYWYANRRCAMDDESGFIIDEFLRQCAESKPDYILIPGDLVDNGRTVIQEHYDVAEKFRSFEQKTGIPIFVINGNHDLGENCAVTRKEFKQIYADFGYDLALETRAEDCSYTANLGEKYRLIALDSCDSTVSTEDGLTADRVQWVKTQTEKAEADGRYPVLMMHHNLIDHMPLQRIINRNFIIRFHYTTAEKFADWGIRTVFTGHEHCSDVSVFTSALGNKIYDFADTALSMYPLNYRVIHYTENEIKYETKTIKQIDTDALTKTVEGYTPEQLKLMNEDLNAYAKGFLKAGLQYRLTLSLSMEKIGIKESDIYYGLVNKAVTLLTDELKLPFYGENSVSTIAARYGITLPKTDYENAWDLAGELVANHYLGSEKLTPESDEVVLLLRTVAVILREENQSLSLVSLRDVADALGGGSDKVQTLYKAAFDGTNPVEYFTAALLAPFLYEFAFDADGVDDNAGTIEGYAVNNNSKNIADNLKYYAEKIFKYFEMIFKIVFKAVNKIVG